MLRIACGVWAVAILLIMWLPDPQFAGLDLASPIVQGAAFAVGAVLFALADPDRPRLLRRHPNSQRAIAYLALRFKGHLVRVALMLAGYAAILEVGQIFELQRRFSVFDLTDNILWIFVASAAVYGLARLLLANRYLSRITRRHLARMAESFRAEAMYSAYLRDVIQAGRAICIAPSIDAADKIERVGRLLDDALGVEIPNPEEELLDTVFGARRSEPAGFRPSAEKV